MSKALWVALSLLLLDLSLVVVSGGVSVTGPIETFSFGVRIALALGLLVVDSLRHPGRSERRWTHAYLALLLLMLLLLHERGYRLRGDGLWYYSMAHSLAFDRDLNLENQYQRLGIDDFSGSRTVLETGLRRYTYPIGAPLVWIPGLGLGHIGVALRNVHGLPTAYDGFADPYFHAVALLNLLVGFGGLLVLDRLLRRWFSPWVALTSVVGVTLGSFLAWYLTYHSIYTHAITFSLVSLFLYRFLREPQGVSDYAFLGFLLGLAACVRWQSAVFSLLVALPLAERLLRKEWRFVLGAGGAFSTMLFFGIVPQVIVWKTIYDRLYIGVPLGADYMRWADPFVTETLFSSRHGLFSWSPILLLGAIGLIGFTRSRPRVGLPFLGMLLLLTYMNSSVADWWGGGSFGARRFDSVLPILAIGLATTVVWITETVRRRPAFVTGGLVAAFVLGNVLLMEQYRKGTIPVDDTISWEEAAQAGLEDVFDVVGYPFSFPMNWIFALRYDRPMTQYDVLIGKYLFHRMNNLGGVIDLGVEDPPFLGNGWSGLRDWGDRRRAVRLAIGARAGIFVPTDRAESLRVLIDCARPEEAHRGPTGDSDMVAVEAWLNGTRLGSFTPSDQMQEFVFTTYARLWRRINLLELSLVSDAETAGAPYLAVDRVRFERIDR